MNNFTFFNKVLFSVPSASCALSLFSRHSISLKVSNGESKSVTHDITSSWTETTLTTTLSDYKLEDIFNADEFGLFCQCLSGKTYHYKGEKRFKGKHSKVRLLACCHWKIKETLLLQECQTSPLPRNLSKKS